MTLSAATAALMLVTPFLLAQQNTTSLLTDDRLNSDSNNFLSYQNGLTLEETIQQKLHFDALHETYVVAAHPPEETRGKTDNRTLNAEIRGLTYNSDVVVIGKPLVRRSAVTAQHKFIFSDYEFQVSAVLSHRTAEVETGNTIVVSRPGGEVKIGDANVRAIDIGFPLFKLGEEYLLFLTRSPSGSYSVRSRTAFAIQDARVTYATLPPLQSGESEPLSAVESLIINAAALNPRGSR